MFPFTIIVLYAIALQLVHALPVMNMKRIVIDPPITSPTADTVWTPGSIQLVTWDTSVVPPNGTFPGLLLLGLQTPDSENLNLDQPLATNFSLQDGSVNVTCPTVYTREQLHSLFGDSGNASPLFTISGPSASDNQTSTLTSDVASPTT
ncbi:hypothetical protein F5888DRAFT_1809525 [Russula emetica]|nr:hypothetical protein F5888DRAFT_1809525 [Russula emetica]